VSTLQGINLDTELSYLFQRDEHGRIILDDAHIKTQKNALEAEGFAVKKVPSWPSLFFWLLDFMADAAHSVYLIGYRV